MEKSPIRLRTYTGEELKLVGKAVVKVCVENQEEVLDLLVVEGSGPSLLGQGRIQGVGFGGSSPPLPESGRVYSVRTRSVT